jgi:hypothetical protein
MEWESGEERRSVVKMGGGSEVRRLGVLCDSEC